MDIYQSPEWGRFMEGIGWQARVIAAHPPTRSCRILIKKLPLLGSIIKILRPPSPLPYNQLEKAAKGARALFVKVEPRSYKEEENLRLHGYIEDRWPLTPTSVIKINLQPPLEEIPNRFHKDARYSVRKAKRNGVMVEAINLGTYEESKNPLANFYKIFKKTGKKKGFFVPHLKELEEKAKAFGEKAFLLFGRFGEPVSGALIILYGKTAYYDHAASTEVGRKLLAQYLVMWETIKLAKKEGCKVLNLGGIYDPRFAVSRKWKALTIFKKKFGGTIKKFPPSYTKYYNPLIRLLFKLNR